MIDLITVTTIVAVLMVGMLLINVAIFRAWRQERRRQLQLLADRLVAEARLEALTVQTLQAMREAARQDLSARGRQ